MNNNSMRNPPSLGDATMGLLSDWGNNIQSGLLSNFPWLGMDLMRDRDAMGQSLLDTGAGIGSIKAVHGSPHKFSKFSDEAMGSGEGRQAFGPGHYSGENVRALDDWYRRRLTDVDAEDVAERAVTQWQSKNPAEFAQLSDAHHPFIRPEDSNFWSPADEAMLTLNRMADQAKAGGANPYVKGSDFHKIYEELTSQMEGVSPGYTYQLNLKPDQADLLHFDKLVEDHPKGLLAKFDEATDGLDQFYERADLEGVNPMGSDLHRYVNRMYGKDEAANILRESGIPGHSFTGQAGKGEPNYVIYDPADIEIVRRIRGGLDSPSPNARQSLLDYVGKGLLND
jgi:hypothetical protein